jgi:hypothetical protein
MVSDVFRLIRAPSMVCGLALCSSATNARAFCYLPCLPLFHSTKHFVLTPQTQDPMAVFSLSSRKHVLLQVQREPASLSVVMVYAQGCVVEINVYADGAQGTLGKCVSPRERTPATSLRHSPTRPAFPHSPTLHMQLLSEFCCLVTPSHRNGSGSASYTG